MGFWENRVFLSPARDGSPKEESPTPPLLRKDLDCFEGLEFLTENTRNHKQWFERNKVDLMELSMHGDGSHGEENKDVCVEFCLLERRKRGGGKRRYETSQRLFRLPKRSYNFSTSSSLHCQGEF